MGRTPHRRRRALACLVGVLLLLGLPACDLFGARPTGIEITADFARGTGLYPGSPVRVLGIDVGRITAVDNADGHVRVRLRLNADVTVPADVQATVVPLTLLGERYVQLGPVYTSGPALADGARIPLARTSVPAEIDELLRGLQDFLGSIDPDRAGDLVTNLAQVLDGQGQKLNQLIHNAAGTVDLLADKGEELRSIITSVSELSETLKGHTDNIETFVRNYDLVTQLLVDNKGDLDATITALDQLVQNLSDLLQDHRDPLKADVDVVTRTGRTLENNTDHLKATLASTVDLFAAAKRAYDPNMRALRANNQIAPTFTTDLIAARMRDRLAGICRRLKIDLCSDPSSPFLNDLAGLLPGLLDSLLSGTPVESPSTDPNPGGPPPPPTDPNPGGPPPPPTAPAAPKVDPAVAHDQLVQALADQLTSGLDATQLGLIDAIDATRLTELLNLDPALLQVLPLLDGAQLDRVRTVPVDQLATTLLDLTNVLRPPSTRVGPLLPPAGTRPGPDGTTTTTTNPLLGGLLGPLLGGGA